MRADLWVGALADDGVAVVARLSVDCTVRLAVSDPGGTVVHSSSVASSGRVVRLEIDGLTADTEYTYVVDSTTEDVVCPVGRFRTPPAAAGVACDFTVAFAGDASNGVNAAVYDTIRGLSPLMFIHLGDAHYSNISTNSQPLFHAAFDEMLSVPRLARLLRDVPTQLCLDDHDYADNDSDATSAAHDASCTVYRLRVPNYAMVDASPTGHMGQTWDVGRVRFIQTDQRSAASAKGNTDNSSKTMLGTSQKTWFKGLLAASPGMLIVWICPRMFGGVATGGADHWGGFTTERTEIGTHIAANCPGRVIVLSADAHALAIDDGSSHTYGGAVIPTFQSAPLSRTPDSVIYGGATYSEGWFNSNGQFGTMAITDAGGSTIGVEWTGYDSTGSVLVTHTFSVTV